MEDNTSYQQEIQHYSLEELYDIAEHIDRENAAERFRMVLAEIKRRKENQQDEETHHAYLQAQHIEQEDVQRTPITSWLEEPQMRRRIRFVIAVIGCFVGGTVLLFRYFTPLPSLEDLTVIHGIVASASIVQTSSRNSDSESLIVKLTDSKGTFQYLDWFPEMKALESEIMGGNAVKFWVEGGHNNWIWQIEKDGKIIRSYQEVRRAIRHNNRFDGLLGGGLLIVGMFGIAYFVVLMQRGSRESESIQ